MPKIEIALSIRQPYAELILRGIKKREYRSRRTLKRNERVHIYASKTPADDAKAWAQANADPGELPTGRFVGSVQITGCVAEKKYGGFAYTLAKPQRKPRALHKKDRPMPAFWRPHL